MTDSTVKVTISADANQLATQVAVAKAQVAALSSEVRNYAKTIVDNGVSSSNAYIGVLSKMQSEATAAATKLKELQAQIKGDSSSGGHGGHGTILGMQSGVFLELRALMDEAASGRMRNFEGSFLRLLGLLGPTIQGFAEANPLIAGMGAAALVAGGGLAYVALQMHAVAVERDEITKGGAFSGNFNIIDPNAREAARQEVDKLRGLFTGLGKDGVAEIINDFQQMNNTSNQVIGAMAADMANMWQQFGTDEKEAGKSIVKLFSDPLQSIEKIKSLIHQLSPEEQAFIEAAQKAGNVLQAQGAIQQVLAQRARAESSKRIADLEEQIAKTREQEAQSRQNADGMSGALRDHEAALQRNLDAAKAVNDSLAGWGPKIANAAETANMLDEKFRKLIEDANKVADSYDRIGAAARKISADSGTLFSGIFQAAKSGDLDETMRLVGALPKLVSDAKVNQQQGGDPAGIGRDAMKQTEEALKKWQADNKASSDQMRTHSAAVWKAMASDQHLSVEQQHEAYEKYLDQVIAGNTSASKASTKAANDQRGATEASLNEQISAVQRHSETLIAHWALLVKLHAMSEAEKTTNTINELAKQKAAVDALYKQLDGMEGLTLTKHQEISDKKVDYDDKNAEKVFEAQKEAALKSQQAWDTTMKSINSAFDSQVNGLLTGSTSWSTAFKNVLKSEVEQGIKGGLNTALTGGENLIKGMFNLGGAAGNVTGAAATTANTTALTALFGALNANTVALGGTVPSLLANTVSTDSNTIATNLSNVARFFGIPGFAVGTPYVAATGLALLHEGEQVVPASQNPYNPRASTAVSGSSAGGGGDSYHSHVHFNGMTDGEAFKRMVSEHAGHIARETHRQFRTDRNLRTSPTFAGR